MNELSPSEMIEINGGGWFKSTLKVAAKVAVRGVLGPVGVGLSIYEAVRFVKGVVDGYNGE
jgi:hypothetical protein